MKQYHVFKLSKDSEYSVIETTGCNTIQELERKYPILKNINWYGCFAQNEQEAIQKAIKANFKS